MPEIYSENPWEALRLFAANHDRRGLTLFLETLTPADVARAMSRLDEREQAAILTVLGPEEAADLLEELSDMQGADIIEELSAAHAAAIVDALVSDHRADILAELDNQDAEAILDAMDPVEAEETRQLMTYDPDTAGGIMVTEFVVFDQDRLASQVLEDMRTNIELYSDIGVQYAYVQSNEGKLVGVLRLRDLVLSRNDKPIKGVMIANPVSVFVDTPLQELEQLFDRYSFMGLPVIDHEGRMVGVAARTDVEESLSERSEKTFMRYSGIIGGEELRNMPLRSRAGKRVTWLMLNLVLSTFAALVIVFFQNTIDKEIALAALIPILSNMTGCSGNQSVAVSIRELTLGIILPRDFLRVARLELWVGVMNGFVLGSFLGAFTYLWKGDTALAVVVGASLCVSTITAVLLGSTIPLMLRRFNIDPAAAAAPMLTTILDMCTFFVVLSLAANFLS